MVALLAFTGAKAQSCLPEGIEFTTQASIDNFQVNYPNCTEIEGNVLIKGWDVTNLNGLIAVNSIGGHLFIADNLYLTSLMGLNNLTTIGQELWISNNSALTSLTGLLTLTSIGGDLTVRNHSTLTSLTGLDNLSFIGGSLYIYSNTSLNNLIGIENLTSIGMHLSIGNNLTLTSLTGLNGLGFIGGRLFIYNNAILNSLTGIENLTSIGDELYLMANNALISLSGLDNIDAESITNLYIYSNVSLSTCDVQSICDYLSSPNGEISIHDNSTGCNSQEEVEVACEEGVTEVVSSQSSVVSYPNPVRQTATFEYNLKETGTVTLAIFNHLGQEIEILVKEQQEQGNHHATWNAQEFPGGIYFYRFTADDESSTGKMVVAR